MEYSKISDLKVMFIIPRRGKGHSEVISSVEVFSDCSVYPEDFIEFFIDYQKQVLTKETIQEIGDNIRDRLKLGDLFINVNFSLPINKLSPSLEESLCFHLDCRYSYKYCLDSTSISMDIECPIRVNYISTIEGNLNLEAIYPSSNLYFEDILDVVQKYGDVVIYPITKASDKVKLLEEVGRGKTVEDYLNFIKIASIHKKISEGGRVNVTVSDLYNNYKIEKGVSW